MSTSPSKPAFYDICHKQTDKNREKTRIPFALRAGGNNEVIAKQKTVDFRDIAVRIYIRVFNYALNDLREE